MCVFERTLNPVSLNALIPAGLMQLPVGIIVFDTELRVAWVNQAAERLDGFRLVSRWRGRGPGEVLPGMDASVIEPSLRRVLATGEPLFEIEVSSRVSEEPAGQRFWSCTQFRVDGPDGEAAGVACMLLEITERACSQRRLALVDEASARIGTTLDITGTAEELLDVALARVADAGAVDLLAAVIDGDHPPSQARGEKLRLQRIAVRWPPDQPAPPDYFRQAWSETSPANLGHQKLVAGSPVFLPAFGDLTPERISELGAVP